LLGLFGRDTWLFGHIEKNKFVMPRFLKKAGHFVAIFTHMENLVSKSSFLRKNRV